MLQKLHKQLTVPKHRKQIVLQHSPTSLCIAGVMSCLCLPVEGAVISSSNSKRTCHLSHAGLPSLSNTTDEFVCFYFRQSRNQMDMNVSPTTQRAVLWFAALALLLTCASTQSFASSKKPAGFRFPPITVPYFVYKANKPLKTKQLAFKTLTGKQPFVLFYFLPQHPHSITELRAFGMAAQLFKGKLKFMAVTKAQNAAERKAAYAKMKSLNLSIPVILDEKGLMAYVMLTRRVPSYAIVTKSGFLRLARASQLAEKVTPSETLLSVLTRVSRGADIPFIRAPGYSPNPFNLLGKKAPSFQAPYALKPGTFRLSMATKTKKPTLLVFWSVTCPHCQATLPPLERYVEKRRKEFHTISIVITPDAKRKKMLTTFVKKHNINTITLNDKKGKAFNKYFIMTVPTLYLISADGKIVDVNMGGGKNVAALIEKMMKKLPKQKTPAKKAKPAARKAPAKREVAGPKPPASRPSK
jgi:thiol-disulfide isomerase/thioredoxin